MPPARRIPENEWQDRKLAIRNMYLTGKMSLHAILRALARDNFNPTKHQLERKLKSWEFNKNVPKRLGEATWRYIGHNITKRKVDGKETQVFLFDEIQSQEKVDKESRRHSGFRYAHESSPEPPEGVRILLRTPPPSQLMIVWPSTLPWLKFEAQYVRDLSLRISGKTSMNLSGNMGRYSQSCVILNMAGFQIESDSPLSQRRLASRIRATMPESYPGENFNRSSIIISGLSKESLREQLMILLFGMSNKATKYQVDWEFLLSTIEYSGILTTTMTINESSLTLLGLREALFQLSLGSMFDPSKYKIRNYMAIFPRTLKLIKWLLASNQVADTVMLEGDTYFTPLQVAAGICSMDLLVLLLDNGADPNFVPIHIRNTFPRRDHHFYCPLHHNMYSWAPPLLQSAYGARNLNDLKVADILLSSGAAIRANRHTNRGFLSCENVFTIAAGNKHEDVALALLETLFRIISSDHDHHNSWKMIFIATDVTIAAASRGHCKVIQFLYEKGFDVAEPNEFGLTALHAAAYGGHVECCRQLLDLGFDADLHDVDLPSPIHLACYQNQFEVVKFLHQRGAQIGRTIRIIKDLCDLIVKRYFCDVPTAQNNQRKLETVIRHQSHISAVLSPHYLSSREFETDFEYIQPPFVRFQVGSRGIFTPLVLYLLDHGAVFPLSAAFWAASYADTEILSIALRRGVDPNAIWNMRHGSGETQSLLEAALDTKTGKIHESQSPSRVATVRMLLDAGAQPTYINAVQAMGLGDWDLVEQILKYDLRDVPMTRGDHDGMITLVEASMFLRNDDLVYEVLGRDSECYSPAALCAAVLKVCMGEIDRGIVSALLATRDRDFSSERYRKLEMTAIGIAACYNERSLMQSLLDSLPMSNVACLPPNAIEIFASKGQNVMTMREIIESNQSDSKRAFWHHGNMAGSVLCFAIGLGIDTVRWLLSYGSRFDWMTISLMVQSGAFNRCLELLPGQQIQPHKDANLSLALSISIKKGDADLLKTLVENFADSIPEQNKYGSYHNPLIEAIEVGNSEIFDVLLAAGFDPRVPALDDGGLTTLQAAAKYNRLGMAKQLVSLGVDINARRASCHGRTALEGAAEHGHIDMIEFLLQQGLETTGIGQRQYICAISFAKDEGHYTAANILRGYRDWTEEDESLLRDENLLVDGRCPNYKVQHHNRCMGSSENNEEDDEYNEDKEDRVKGARVDTEDYCNHQPTMGPTLLDPKDNALYSDRWFSTYKQISLEPDRSISQLAPSAGIYDLDESLFGINGTCF